MITDNIDETVSPNDIFRTLGYNHSIDLMRRLQKSPTSFTRLKKDLGLNPNQLNMLLSSLLESKLIEHKGRLYSVSLLGCQMLTVSNMLNRVQSIQVSVYIL